MKEQWISRYRLKKKMMAWWFVAAVLVVLHLACTQCNKTIQQQSLRFGLIADVHYGLAPDAQKRLQVFIDDMNRQKVDFIIQLGVEAPAVTPITSMEESFSLSSSFSVST